MKKPETIYAGMPGRLVTVDGVELTAERSLKHVNHSPDGFNWGYGGSGPAQLAFAILLDYYEDLALVQHYYQEFKRDHVANWQNGEGWIITGDQIHQWFQTKGLY